MPFQKFPRRLLLSVATIATAIIALAAFPNTKEASRIYSNQGNNRKQSAEMVMPVVDYDEGTADNKLAVSAESKSLELRKARNGRYDNNVWVSKDWQGRQSVWLCSGGIGLSALPVAQSDVIVSGEVISSLAYLSNDKSGVYSEFSIRVDEVHKPSKIAPLATGDMVAGERSGGAVRYPSGRITQFFTSGQGFPLSGRRYVFFLKMNESGGDYHILTGYQIHKGKIRPLDPIDLFALYKGRDQTVFFNDLREAIAQAEKGLPPKGGEIK